MCFMYVCVYVCMYICIYVEVKHPRGLSPLGGKRLEVNLPDVKMA